MLENSRQLCHGSRYNCWGVAIIKFCIWLDGSCFTAAIMNKSQKYWCHSPECEACALQAQFLCFRWNCISGRTTQDILKLKQISSIDVFKNLWQYRVGTYQTTNELTLRHLKAWMESRKSFGNTLKWPSKFYFACIL